MRKYERHAYRSPAVLRLQLGPYRMSTEYVCTVLDVSEGGIKFEADFKFDVGASFVLWQPRYGGEGIMELSGKIAWFREVDYRVFHYGAMLFDEDGSESGTFIKEVHKLKYYNIFSLNQFI